MDAKSWLPVAGVGPVGTQPVPGAEEPKGVVHPTEEIKPHVDPMTLNPTPIRWRKLLTIFWGGMLLGDVFLFFFSRVLFVRGLTRKC